MIKLGQFLSRPPRCPLCLNPMVMEYDHVRKIKVFACHRDRIAINMLDPLVGTWEDKHEKIECPNCGASMRVFFTSTGYMKSVCPKKKCRCSVTGSNPDRMTMALSPALKLDGVNHKDLTPEEKGEA